MHAEATTISGLTPTVSAQDHLQGPLTAAAVLVEYGDFQCSFCREAFVQLKAVRRVLGDRLCFVYRHFPLIQIHPFAERAAEFAEAAGKVGKFWEMHDLLYEHQEALTRTDLVTYAQQLGLDAKLIDEALNGHFTALVQRDLSSGLKSGVNSTPALFLNGERHDGPRDADTLIELLRG